MGTRLVSWKGSQWRGRTTLATNDRGDRRCVDITNGYVSMDGHEIRSFPGWRTLIDLSEENNPDGGYSRYIIDAMRPVMQPVSPAQFYTEEYRGDTTDRQTLRSRAKPMWLEWYKQVGDQVIIGGITRFREDPIYSSARVQLEVDTVSTTTEERFLFTMNANIAARSLTDATGAGLNGLAEGDVVYGEDFTSDDSAVQTELDNRINGRVHLIDGISGPNLVLRTASGIAPIVGATITGGNFHRVRPNRNDVYSTPFGANPFDVDSDARIDDWNALTTWRIIPTLPLEPGNAASHVCHPAWVANRMRDFSDETHYYPEGILVGGTTRGVSRREQKELPFRMVPEAAGDRIIIAAPGYNCLFQVPLMVPDNPDQWPSTPTVENLGVQWFGNDIYDKPRALGVPKCRLIDSPFTPAQASPSDSTTGVAHFMTAIAASPQFSFPPGVYKMCCTYQDDVTGEEGDPSEIIEFRIPNNDYAYIVYLTYFHPGYIMPECLAFRLNIYLSDTDGEAMGFYKSLDLRDEAASANQHLGFALDASSSPWTLSGKYGFFAGATPGDFAGNAEWRRQAIPIPRSGLGGIDFFRPPLIVGMPRGASCARMIRDTMIAVGHQGVVGPSKGLYQQYGSIRVDATLANFMRPNQIHTRIHGTDFLAYADGAQTDGFGVAGRAFPDSCEGIEAVSVDLLPTGMSRHFVIDKVLNRVVNALDSAGYNDAQTERLQTIRPVVDVDFGASPGDSGFPTKSVTDKAYFLKMFKGQMQVGDPGAPYRVTTIEGAGVQLLDPLRDDDCHSVYQLAGNAIICSRKETYFFSWSRSAGASKPAVISLEHGCIAPNSMVAFDGGVAWIGERGPVAMGASLQFIGADIIGDFDADRPRYVTDAQGMMRHTWGCHDSTRGLVLWGMLTQDPVPFHVMNDGGGSTIFTFQADDGQLSRAPCNEVLIWSYRTGSFSRWVPPEGMEIIWMEEMRVRDGYDTRNTTVRLTALGADGRIYHFDDSWNDCNIVAMTTTAASAGTASTTLVTSATGWVTDGVANGGHLGRANLSVSGPLWTNFLVRPAQVVQAFNEDNEIEWETTVESADPATDTITLAAAQTWTSGQTIRVGVRQSMVIETTYLGAEELMNFDAKAVQMRYTLHGSGRANAAVTVKKSDLDTNASPTRIGFPARSEMLDIGTESGDRHARRRSFQGAVTGPEVACLATISGEAQVRIADLSLETD